MAAIPYRQEYGWQYWYEAFCICRHCGRSTIFVLSERLDGDYRHVHEVGLLKVEGALNNYVEVKGHISLKDQASATPPDHIPQKIESVFREGRRVWLLAVTTLPELCSVCVLIWQLGQCYLRKKLRA